MLDEKWSQIFGQNVEILAIAHGVSNEVIIFDAVHFLLLARLIIKSMLYYKKKCIITLQTTPEKVKQSTKKQFWE